MMKRGVKGLITGCLVASAGICLAKGISFSTIEPAMEEYQVMNLKEDDRQAIETALDIHNLMFDLRSLEQAGKQLSLATKIAKLDEMKLEALENCSINKMADQFQDPAAVWDKMKAEYDRREKELSIYVNSTEPPTEEQQEAFKNYMEKGEMTPDMVAEMYAPWQIGRDILIDVYQNQDKWGDRKEEKSASFPLWEDQKYTFDKEWDAYYTELNTYFGVPPQGRPIIGDEKYDYAKADEVAKAHEIYLAALVAKNPAKGAVLAAALKNPPVAPKPLPPKNEIIVYMETDDPNNQVYPALPEPWQQYAQNGFKEIDPKGEMAEDFENGLTLKEEAKNEDQTNRLVAYSSLKQNMEGKQIVEGITYAGVFRQMDRMQLNLSKYVQITPETDLLDADVRADILEQLKELQVKVVAEAENKMKERSKEDSELLPVSNLEDIDDLAELKKINPEAFKEISIKMPTSVYEQDEWIIKALKADPEGVVYINEVNAGEIDKMMKEQKAREAFFNQPSLLENRLAQAMVMPIDDTCLNGGV